MRTPTSFLLVVKAGHAEAATAAANMRSWFLDRKLSVRVIQADVPSDALCAEARSKDALIVLGGDGTVVGVCRKLASGAGPHPPYLGVNFGQVGFLAEAPRENWEPWLHKLIAGKLAVRSRMLLDWTVHRDGAIWAKGFAVNDIVVGRGSLARVLPVRVVIEDAEVENPDHDLNHDLGWIRSDGILVSTPQGTSAYALSAHGPLLHPDIAALALTPISPFYKSFAPMVLPPDRRIRLETLERSASEVFLTVDGQEGLALEGGDSVVVRGIVAGFCQLTPLEDTYFQRLRERGFIQTPDSGPRAAFTE